MRRHGCQEQWDGSGFSAGKGSKPLENWFRQFRQCLNVDIEISLRIAKLGETPAVHERQAYYAV
jgi:hypothetical protein